MLLNDNGETLGTSPVEIEGAAGGSPLLLNEVSLWNRALGAGEIASLYSAGTNGIGVVALSAGSVAKSQSGQTATVL